MQKYCFAIITIFLAFTACKTTKHNSKKQAGVWQAQPIVADGNDKDWPAPYPDYDSKAMLGYAVSNDKENLYITVETGDLATQLKILRNGLTVWIDKTGQEEQKTAVNYPLENNSKYTGNSTKGRTADGQWEDGAGNDRAAKQRNNLEDRIKQALGEATSFSLEGFKMCNNRYQILEKDSCGIITSIGLTPENELVWEAVVPLKTFYYKAAIDSRDKGKPISICFETVGLQKPSGSGNGGNNTRPHMSMGGGGMGMGMRMGGMGGGGMHGGGNRGAAQNNSILEPLYKSTTTWKKFGIAYQGS